MRMNINDWIARARHLCFGNMQHAAWLKVGKLQRLPYAVRRFEWQGRRAGRHFACQQERTDALKQVSPADSVHESSKLNRSLACARLTRCLLYGLLKVVKEGKATKPFEFGRL